MYTNTIAETNNYNRRGHLHNSSDPRQVYCTVLYCTALYCTVLYCTVLYCTALHSNVTLIDTLRRDAAIEVRVSESVIVSCVP
jgi:hypothetical protein